jgi:prepilin-type processing-associated H-X9-DG protein
MTARTIGRHNGRATFEMADGHTFDVMCSYVVEQKMVEAGSEHVPGLVGWRGYFTTDYALVQPGAGTIRLKDGREARIIVTTVDVAAGDGEFSGAGPPPT